MDWSDIFNYIAEGAQDRASLWYNNYQADKTRQWQEEMWNKSNEYNSPVNQRKRLEDAGINPNLAFGSSASAMGFPAPTSSPTPQVSAKFDLARLATQYAAIKRENAQTKQMDAQTEQIILNNEMLSALFNDRLQTERGDLYIKRLQQGWNEDNLSHLLDVGLQNKELENDLKNAMILYYDAKTDLSKESLDRLIQDYEHLQNKYRFEDDYYNRYTNPYETSTILGILRYLIGNIQSLIY